MEKLINPSRRRLFTKKTPAINHQRLPWVISEDVFSKQCTQCQDCITSCEEDIIVKDELGFPKIDFSLGECTFCNKCIDICQQPLFISPKDRITQDKTSIRNMPWSGELEIKNNCLAKSGVYCQSCRDACETEAINFIYIKNGDSKIFPIPRPEINLADCTQCGACVSTCPQDSITLTLTN